jgi:hypothetical protein
MNRLLFISGMVVFVATAFLIMSIPNTANAFSCSASSSTPQTRTQAGVSGSSGGCAITSNAASNSSPIIRVTSTASGVSAATISGTATSSTTGSQGSFVSGAGGGQSSCTSSSQTSSGGITMTQTVTSKQGTCP